MLKVTRKATRPNRAKNDVSKFNFGPVVCIYNLDCKLVAGVMIPQFNASQAECTSVDVLGPTVYKVYSTQYFDIVCRPAITCNKHFTTVTFAT